MEYEILSGHRIERYSHSKLKTFEQCPYQYKLHYIDYPPVEGESNGFSELGSHAHSILERHLRGEIQQFEMSSVFEEEFAEKVPSGVSIVFDNGYRKYLTDSYKEQCKLFFDTFEGFEGYEVVGIEEGFNYVLQLGDKLIELTGIIDVILKDQENNYYIVDWKSKSAFANKNEVEEYAKQLYIYSLHVQHKYGKFPVELQFYQFRIRHKEIIKFSKKSLDNTLEWVYNTVNGIEQEQFYLPMDFETGKDSEFYCRNLCLYGKGRICECYKEYCETKGNLN